MQYILEFIQCLLDYREPRSFRLFPSHCLDPCYISSPWHEMMIIDHMATSVEEKGRMYSSSFIAGEGILQQLRPDFPFRLVSLINGV